MRLLEGIHLTASGECGYSHTRDCNCYGLDTGEGIALIDTGAGHDNARLLQNLEEDGLDPHSIRWLLHTHVHYDHAAGTAGLRAETGAEVWIHSAEADALETADPVLTLKESRQAPFDPCPVDRRLEDGERVALGGLEIEVIHAPGHSPGSVIFSLKRGGRTVWFCGDVLKASGYLPLMNIPGSDIYQYRDTLKRLVNLPVDAFFSGHGMFVLSDARKHLQWAHQKLTSPWRDIVHAAGEVVPRITFRR